MHYYEVHDYVKNLKVHFIGLILLLLLFFLTIIFGHHRLPTSIVLPPPPRRPAIRIIIFITLANHVGLLPSNFTRRANLFGLRSKIITRTMMMKTRFTLLHVTTLALNIILYTQAHEYICTRIRLVQKHKKMKEIIKRQFEKQQ